MVNYGFVIDNNKCIGCHACTVACKAEHNVPVGVFRTWVKYVETGNYPDTRRLFSVMRCNHCEDPPCVKICPVTALFQRKDGIVDFDKTRCIGCKSCMQACPYDALYIDPETHTSAKCNFCANRVDQGLQPACVVVCPEQAIIAGDIENPETIISQIMAKNNVTVRKPEKGTRPNLFYIEGDSKVLTPQETDRNMTYLWNTQSSGVGHYAGKTHYNHKMIHEDDVVPNNKRVYDAPAKGRLWGYEFPAYMVTKSLSTGIGVILSIMFMIGVDFTGNTTFLRVALLVSLAFLGLTGLFLVLDLDQPLRFYYIFLRPQWRSWLVRGAFLILIFGTVSTLIFLNTFIPAIYPPDPLYVVYLVSAFLASAYTAFLLAQAKGRDFWQSPILPFEKLGISTSLGAASLLVINTFFGPLTQSQYRFILVSLIVSMGAVLIISLMEAFVTQASTDAYYVARSFRSGAWAKSYWGGLFLGTIVPLVFILHNGISEIVGGVSMVIGLYVLSRAWIYAPQDMHLV